MSAEFDALLDILRWLKDGRPVLTITGAQGTGKSRLARNVAESWSKGRTIQTTATLLPRSKAPLRLYDLVIVDECTGETAPDRIGRKTLYFGTPGAFPHTDIELPSRTRQ